MIACSDWSQLKYCSNLADAIHIFYDTINSFFEVCVPLVTPISSVRPPWFSKHYKKFKKSGNPSDFNRYEATRANFIALNSYCYNDYLQRCKLESSRNPKQLYKFENTKRKSVEYSPSLNFNNISL